jgi:casein kinase I family protein HRR25
MTDREAEQSRRDNLKSLEYILLYFLRDSLPWQKLEAKTKAQKYKLMIEIKNTIGIDELYNQMPREFTVYMNHIRALKFKDKPNYTFLRRVFRELFIRRRFKYDNVFN